MKKHINLIIILFLVLDILLVYVTFFGFKERNESVKFYGDENSLVDTIKVEYTVTGNPFAKVEVKDISKTTSQINDVAAKVGNSFDISGNFSNSQLEKAKVTIQYDRNNLPEDVDEDNLGILWYDEENNKMVVMKSKVNTDDEEITFTTTHFSEYIIVDFSKWEEIWQQDMAKVREKNSVFSLEFIIDDSGSMYDNDPNNLRLDATRSAINALGEEDRYLIMKFESSYTVLQSFTTDTSLADEALEQFKSNGGTNIVSSVTEGIELFKDEGKKREKILILLTDGEDYSLSSNVDKLIESAKEENVIIFTIGLKPYTDSNLDFSVISKLATETNGKFHEIDEASLANIFLEITNSVVGIDGSLDNDKDGIPDGIEIAGMRDQFGQIIKTNPYLKDSDGDGISDGDEMGTQKVDKNGNIYYQRVSNPNVNEMDPTSRLSVRDFGPSSDLTVLHDSGFRPETNGFSFRNFDYNGITGLCSGMALLVEKIYNNDLAIENGKYGTELDAEYFRTLITNKNLYDYKMQEDMFDWTKHSNPAEINDLEKDITDKYEKQLIKEIYSQWLISNNKIGEEKVDVAKAVDKYYSYKTEVKQDVLEKLGKIFDSGKIITISFQYDGGAHSINGYALEKMDLVGNKYRLYVYDNNRPYGTTKDYLYIEFTKNEDGKYDFYYKYDDGKEYSTVSENSILFLQKNSVIK